MIPIPNNFDNARAYDGNSFPRLPLGGHICRIHNARMERNSFGADMLVIDFDVYEGGEFDKYYKRRHELNYRRNAAAKWPGVFRVNLLNRDGECGSYFKGLIKALEESNTGYNFKASNGDERAMSGLYFGLVFGEREFETSDTHEIKVAIEPFYACSVAKVREGVSIPAKKTLHRDAPAQAQALQRSAAPTSVDDMEEELPF